MIGALISFRLQNGRFDSADRLFASVREAWESATSAPADVKELVAEFFLPGGAFLINRHKLALGSRQNGCAGISSKRILLSWGCARLSVRGSCSFLRWGSRARQPTQLVRQAVGGVSVLTK